MSVDALSDFSAPRIFRWIDVSYNGDPSFSVSLDGEDTETTPSLNAVTSGLQTVRVSFRGGVRGFIPHYRDSSDTGEIFGVRFETEVA